jgi:hypothetical protein
VFGDALVPPLACVAGLLVAAGLAKLAAPTGAVESLRSAGIAVGGPVVRVLACAEVALGAAVLAIGGTAGGALVAVTYALFVAFALIVSRRAEQPVDCGCFGAAAATSAVPHLVMNAAAVATGVLAAIAHAPAPLAWMAGQSAGVALVLAIGTAAAVYAAYLAVTVLPAAWASFPRSAR